MTRSLTLVTAHHTQFSAVLFADVGCHFTGTRMTQFNALVTSAFQWFLTGHATGEFALATGNGFAFLVITVAEDADEGHARWTIGGRVTVVSDGMRTGMLSGTWFVAWRLFGATRNRWIDDLGSAFAVQFHEGRTIATLAATLVTGLVAFVFATG